MTTLEAIKKPNSIFQAVANFPINVRLTLSILLFFFAAGYTIIANSYLFALFLSAYPSSWLPYLYIVQAILATSSLFLGKQLVNPHLFAIRFLIFSLISNFIFLFLIRNKVPFAIFLFATIQGNIIIYLSTCTWSLVSANFDLREFKNYVSWISTGSYVGGSLCGFVLPSILSISSADIMLEIMIGIFIIILPLVFFLKPQRKFITSQEENISINAPWRYSLFFKLSLFILCIGITFTLVEYIFFTMLKTHYDKNGIAKYLGVLFAITNGIRLVLSAVGMRLTIKYLGVGNLLFLSPIVTSLFCLMLLFSPHLLVSSELYASLTIFYMYTTLDREMLLNALPYQIRVSGKLQISLVNKAGQIVGSLILISLAIIGFQVQVLSALVLFLGLIFFYLISRIKKAYQSTLSNAVSQLRFGVDQKYLTQEEELQYQEAAELALQKGDTKSIRFGFHLLFLLKNPSIPKTVLKFIDFEEADIRISTIKFLKKHPSSRYFPILSKRLNVENDSEVIWHLFDALAAFPYSQEVAEIAKNNLKNADIKVKAAGIRYLFSSINEEDISIAKKYLSELLESTQEDEIIAGLEIISSAKLKNYEVQVKSLLNNNSEKVVIAAIRTLVCTGQKNVIPILLEKINNKTLFNEIKLALIHFNEESLKPIIEKIKNKPSIFEYTKLIDLLAQLPTPQAEIQLLNLIVHNQYYEKNIILKNLAYRQQNQNFFLDKQRLRELLFSETEIALILKSLIVYEGNENIQAELKSRLQMTTENYLYLLVLYTQNKKILDAMPTILYSSNQIEVTKAIELLDTFIKERSLVPTLTAVLEKQHVKAYSLTTIQHHLDAWCKKLLLKENEACMFDPQRIFILRKVSLFKDLPAELLDAIANYLESRDMFAGQILFKEGDPPTGMFIIVSGEVEILREGKQLALLHDYDYFGELALLDNTKRLATAVATTDGTLFYLSKPIFDRLTDDLPQILKEMIQIILQYLRKDIITLNKVE